MEEIQEPTLRQTDTEFPENGESNPMRTVGLVIGVVLILAILGAALYGMVSYPLVTAVIRDISIIVLALVTIIIGLFLVVLIFQLQSLIALLRDEIKPILDSANETASTVRGTTTFVSDSVVRPMIEAASMAAGVGRAIRLLAGSNHKKAKKETKHQEK
ncbi:MAG: hypothetical protein PVJ34_01945 [Anaerolineae bacterium]|jgi:hypothetical protein